MGKIIQLIDSNTKESVNYEEVTTWYDGSLMDDSKVDNYVYRKKGTQYYRNASVNKSIKTSSLGGAFSGLQKCIKIVDKIDSINIIIIDSIIDLGGQTIEIPEGVTIDFSGGGTFKNGRFLINSNVKLLGSNTTITGIARSGLPLIETIQNSSNIEIRGINVFSDCIKTDVSNANNRMCFAEINGGERIIIENCHTEKKVYGIKIKGSKNVKITNYTFSGLFDDPFDHNGPQNINANYHYAVSTSGQEVYVDKLNSKNSGGGVVAGTTNNKLTVLDSIVTNAWDNGIYVSTGTYCIISNISCYNCRGTGIKTRGSCNIVSNSIIENAGGGIASTGNGNVLVENGIADIFESNGFGNVITGNTIRNIMHYAIDVYYQDGFLPKGTVITNNSIVNASLKQGFAAIRAWGNFHLISNNIIQGTNEGLAAIIAGGDTSNETRRMGLHICNNFIYDSMLGIYVIRSQDLNISSNIFYGITAPSKRAIRLIGVYASRITGNIANYPSSTIFIEIGDGNSIYGNTINITSVPPNNDTIGVTAASVNDAGVVKKASAITGTTDAEKLNSLISVLKQAGILT